MPASHALDRATPAVRTALAAGLLATFAATASAQMLPPPQGVVNLNASASVEVPKDLLAITFSTSRDGPDAASVQTALKQALDAALAEARKVQKPGQIDVRTGNFSLYPRHAPKQGGIVGWQGSAELVAEGRDMNGIAQLAGRITTLSIARVAQGLSREAREKVEAEVAAQAIARFRTRAAETARAFGYEGYTLREVSVQGTEPPPPMPVLRMQAMAKDSAEALPVEAGIGTVSASVNGSIQLK